MSGDADRLRRRAVALRTFAQQIRAEPVWSMIAMADADTWMGPRPTTCVDELRRNLEGLDAAVEQLLRDASRHERTADDIDAATAT